MYETIEVAILAGSAIASILVALLVSLNSRWHAAQWIYLSLTSTFMVLIFANYFSMHDSAYQIYFIRTVLICTALSFGLIYLFLKSLNRNFSTPRGKSIPVAGSAMAIIALISGSPLVFSSVDSRDGISISVGPLIVLYVLYVLVMIGALIFALQKGLRSKSVASRHQHQLLLVGVMPAAVIAPITSFMLPVLFANTGLILLSPLYVLFFVVMAGVAMVRHGLLDVKIAAVRTLGYFLSLVAMAIIYFALAYVFSVIMFDASMTDVNTSAINVVLALILAFVFQPIKRFFDRATDKIFFRDQYSVGEFIAKIGEISTSTTNLRTLLGRASQAIRGTLKSTYATFIIHRERGNDIILGSGDDPRLVAGEHTIITEVIAENPKDIIVSDRHKAVAVRTITQRHDIAIIVPLGQIGYLLLGGQKSGGYKQRDIRALQAIKNELFIAIQNVRSVQEVHDLNIHLQQRIDEATKELRASNNRLRRLDETKDEFMSIASHQLRTPLTSIKGYLSMMLDGDLGPVPAQQKKVLREALGGSERMVNLISDFLNISRLQTGKFVIDHIKTDVEKLVAGEVKNLQQGAKSRDLTLHFHRSDKKIPPLYVDEVKLRQVVMNFIDNSLYYSRPGEEINVYVERKSGHVEVRVVDAGIGVPKAEQERLFTKFFRATNAHKRRPDGTGVGLFLAKKVIDGHGGEILFHSKENKGSTFGFRIPIAPLSKQPGE